MKEQKKAKADIVGNFKLVDYGDDDDVQTTPCNNIKAPFWAKPTSGI